jgi:hypothetical protein
MVGRPGSGFGSDERVDGGMHREDADRDPEEQNLAG